MNPNTLSKSRFKVAITCPRKLAYLGDQRYVSTLDDDEFLVRRRIHKSMRAALGKAGL